MFDIKLIPRLIFSPQKTMKRFEPRYKKAQEWLDNEVVKDCTPLVPMDTGQLYQSGIRATKYGSGEVVYNAPHAARIYYGKHFNFSKDKHPQAQAFFFEGAKAVNKTKWINGVKKFMRG